MKIEVPLCSNPEVNITATEWDIDRVFLDYEKLMQMLKGNGEARQTARKMFLAFCKTIGPDAVIKAAERSISYR
jgi:hypothetical protein